MKKNIFTLFVILVFASSKLFSQNYGNEWINFDLKYVKINLSAEGIYKINFDDVNSKNLFSGNLNPNNFQLFNKGVEVPLYITGSQDGLFNQGDIIYFYGTKNNASGTTVTDTTKPKTTPKEEIKTKATDAIKGLLGGKKKKE